MTEAKTTPLNITREMIGPHPDGHDIPHLLSPVLLGRHALAAHFLRHCEHIVELGGHKEPITPFLMHEPKSVLSMDPKMDPLEAELLHGKPCRIRHVASKFQVVDFDLEPFTYGFLILGYSVKGHGEERPDSELLFQLVDNAKCVVIDHVIDFERSETQLPNVLNRGTMREVCRIDLTFDDEIIHGLPYAKRRLLVLEPATT